MAQAKPARLALDEDIRPLLARLLRDRGWDAVPVVEAGRAGAPDEEQLAWATREGRVLVTHNAGDFAAIAGEWTRADRSHAGIFIARQGPMGWLLRELLKALGECPSSAHWTRRVVWAGPPPRR